MATSLRRECSAAASTSGRTPPACWSPRHARAACARSSSGARSPAWDAAWRPAGRSRRRGSPRPRASSPSSTRWPSRPARETIRAVATAVIRRAANRDEFCDAIRDARRRRGVRARRRGGGAAGLPGRHAHARPAAAGARRGRRRGRRLDRDRRRDARRRRRVVGLVRVRLGLPGRRLPGRRPADAPTSCDAVRMHAARALDGDRLRPGRHRDRGRRQRGLAAPARRRRCSTSTSLARALGVLTSGPAADVAARFDLDAAARAADARRAAALDAAGARARPAAADRLRRAARGRPARPGRRCNNSFTIAPGGLR